MSEVKINTNRSDKNTNNVTESNHLAVENNRYPDIQDIHNFQSLLEEHVESHEKNTPKHKQDTLPINAHSSDENIADVSALNNQITHIEENLNGISNLEYNRHVSRNNTHSFDENIADVSTLNNQMTHIEENLNSISNLEYNRHISRNNARYSNENVPNMSGQNHLAVHTENNSKNILNLENNTLNLGNNFGVESTYRILNNNSDATENLSDKNIPKSSGKDIGTPKEVLKDELSQTIHPNDDVKIDDEYSVKNTLKLSEENKGYFDVELKSKLPQETKSNPNISSTESVIKLQQIQSESPVSKPSSEQLTVPFGSAESLNTMVSIKENAVEYVASKEKTHPNTEENKHQTFFEKTDDVIHQEISTSRNIDASIRSKTNDTLSGNEHILSGNVNLTSKNINISPKNIALQFENEDSSYGTRNKSSDEDPLPNQMNLSAIKSDILHQNVTGKIENIAAEQSSKGEKQPEFSGTKGNADAHQLNGITQPELLNIKENIEGRNNHAKADHSNEVHQTASLVKNTQNIEDLIASKPATIHGNATDDVESDRPINAKTNSNYTDTSEDHFSGRAIDNSLPNQVIGDKILTTLSQVSDTQTIGAAESMVKVGHEIVERIMVLQATMNAKQEVVIVFKDNVLPGTQLSLVREGTTLHLGFTTANQQSLEVLTANHSGLRHFLLDQLKDISVIDVKIKPESDHYLANNHQQNRQQRQNETTEHDEYFQEALAAS